MFDLPGFDLPRFLVPGVVGGVAGGLAVLLWGLMQPARRCPRCEAPVPKIRKPANARQRMWGGWTCTTCGAELDRKAKLLPDSPPDARPPRDPDDEWE